MFEGPLTKKGPRAAGSSGKELLIIITRAARGSQNFTRKREMFTITTARNRDTVLRSELASNSLGTALLRPFSPYVSGSSVLGHIIYTLREAQSTVALFCCGQELYIYNGRQTPSILTFK